MKIPVFGNIISPSPWRFVQGPGVGAPSDVGRCLLSKRLLISATNPPMTVFKRYSFWKKVIITLSASDIFGVFF